MKSNESNEDTCLGSLEATECLQDLIASTDKLKYFRDSQDDAIMKEPNFVDVRVNKTPCSPISQCLKKLNIAHWMLPGSTGSTVVTLIKITLGAGTLGIPYAYSAAGGLLFTIFLIISCVATVYSIYLIGVCTHITGLRTYEEMSRVLVGKYMEYITTFLFIVYCWGGNVIYIVSMKAILDPLRRISWIPSVFDGKYGLMLLITLFWLICFPLCLPVDINTLRYFSLFGVATTFYLLLTLVISAAGDSNTSAKNIELVNFSFNMIQSISVAFFSFGCQPNCPQLIMELRERTVKNLTVAGGISQLICTTVYALAGLIAFAEFGINIKGNILDNLDPIDKPYVAVAFFAVTINIILTFPISIFPSRDSILQLFGYPTPSDVPGHVRVFTSGTLAVTALILAFFVPGIQILFSLIGSIAGSTVAFIWPSIFLIQTGEWTVEKVGWKQIVCTYLMIIFGTIAGLLGTAQSIYQIF